MDINSIVITSVVAISLIEDDYQKIDPALHTLYTFNVGGNIFSPGRRRQPWPDPAALDEDQHRAGSSRSYSFQFFSTG